MEARPRSFPYRCIHNVLEQYVSLPFSPFLSHFQVPPEVTGRQDIFTYDSSNMANTVLVATNFRTSNSQTHSSTPTARPVDVASLRRTAPSEESVKDDGMSIVRQCFRAKGISEQASNILMQSWRGSTKKQYSCYIKQWITFCLEKQVDTTSPHVNSVLDFLTELYNKGLTYSAINTARSALSTFILPIDGKPIGQNHLVSRLIKGIYQLRPNTPKYKCIWDVNEMLKCLAQLYPLDKLSLKDLTLKLVMLMLLVSGQRGQTIHLLDLRNMIQQERKICFLVTENVKQSRPGVCNPQLCFEAYTNPKVCVFLTLQEYIARTRSLRSGSQLLISFVKPYKGVSRDTVTRWVRAITSQAGIDMSVYSPHSTRAASVSAAFKGSVKLQDILATAGWSSAFCFAKFYNKPIVSSGYASSILSTLSN